MLFIRDTTKMQGHGKFECKNMRKTYKVNMNEKKSSIIIFGAPQVTQW